MYELNDGIKCDEFIAEDGRILKEDNHAHTYDCKGE